MISGRRRSVIFFTVLGICLVALAVTLNISWVVLNWGRALLLVLGIVLFIPIIAGMVLNTIFLVREIRRNEQHDSFINAVTHELKTPVASIRLYLQTLQSRELDDEKRREFYRIMLEDSDRLLQTIEQVLQAGSSGSRWRRISRTRLDLGLLSKECVELARTRFHLTADALGYEQRVPAGACLVSGDPDELKAAIWNLIDNAIKYLGRRSAGARGARGGRRRAARRQGERPRRRDFARRAQADLPQVLSHSGQRGHPREGQRPRPLHRAVGRQEARRARVCRERGTGTREHVHSAAAEGNRSMSVSPQRVLIVEDELHLAEGLRFNLEAEGFAAEVVDTGEAALERLLGRQDRRFDLVVLDVMLPGKDGFAVVSELRAARQFVPVLMLTARGRPEDVLNGFAAGADDYLPKPTELAILLARVGGLLRRSQWQRQATDRYSFAGRTIDFETQELRVGERAFPLTLMETNLLRYLITHAGTAVSRKAMLEEVWGLREDTDTRAIDNFIVRLRRYIEQDPSKPKHLLTVRGVGYRFVAEPGGSSS